MKIFLINYTKTRSGPGSTVAKTKNIRLEIPKLIKKYNIKTMFDCPCSNLNWISMIFDKIPKYVGGDISKLVINDNKKLYNKEFIIFDLRHDKINKYDLLLVRDCLYHLSIEDIFKVLENIKKSNVNFILVTNFYTFDHFKR